MATSKTMKERWANVAEAAKMAKRPNLEIRNKQITEDGVISCAKCNIPKPLDDFPKHRKNRKGQPRYAYCKTCHSEAQREVRYRNFFKITVKEYEDILDFQKGVCAICHNPPKKTRLAVDHCHKTGLIRGLLCMWCNRAIGQFRDDMTRVQRVYDYFYTPPATARLGEARFGLKGRVSNKKKTRDRLNKTP